VAQTLESRRINLLIQGVRKATRYEDNCRKSDLFVQMSDASGNQKLEVGVQVKYSEEGVRIFEALYGKKYPVIAVWASPNTPGDLVLERLLGCLAKVWSRKFGNLRAKTQSG